MAPPARLERFFFPVLPSRFPSYFFRFPFPVSSFLFSFISPLHSYAELGLTKAERGLPCMLWYLAQSGLEIPGEDGLRGGDG